MPASCGRWGHTPEWATTGLEPSLVESVSVTLRSSTVRFQEGSSWARTRRRRARRTDRVSPLRHDPGSPAQGSWWAHHTATEGWWASWSTAARAIRRAWDLADALDRPLQRQVLPDEHPEPVGGVVELGAGEVPVDPQQIEPRPRRRFHVGRHLLGGGLGGQGPGGADRDPLQEEGLVVDPQHEVAHPHLAQAGPPGARRG